MAWKARAWRRRSFLAASAAGAGFSCALLLLAYNPIQDQSALGLTVHAHWPNAAITWELNPSIGPNVDTSGGTSASTAIQTAWSVWKAPYPNGQVLTAIAITQGPNTTLTDPNNADCQNIISFVPSSSVSFPTGVIAFTEVTTHVVSPGETSQCGAVNSTSAPVSFVTDADVVFNPHENFSTATPSPAGDFDVQSVGTHEFGHALGLDHSGLGHAIMFPFGDAGEGQQRNLAVDDVAGMAFLYPNSSFEAATGILSGVIALHGSGVFAAHVVAVDAQTGAVVVDRLTDPDGTFRILGVPPGSYNVFALPLARDSNSGLYVLDNFSGWTCGYGENSSPCCDPATAGCSGKLQNPTGYTGKFY